MNNKPFFKKPFVPPTPAKQAATPQSWTTGDDGKLEALKTAVKNLDERMKTFELAFLMASLKEEDGDFSESLGSEDTDEFVPNKKKK